MTLITMGWNSVRPCSTAPVKVTIKPCLWVLGVWLSVCCGILITALLSHGDHGLQTVFFKTDEVNVTTLINCHLSLLRNFRQQLTSTIWRRRTASHLPFEFLHISKLPVKSWQDPASIEGEEQNKKKLSLPVIEPTTSRS